MFELSKQPVGLFVSFCLILYSGLSKPTSVGALRPRARVLRKDVANHVHSRTNLHPAHSYSNITLRHRQKDYPLSVKDSAPLVTSAGRNGHRVINPSGKRPKRPKYRFKHATRLKNSTTKPPLPQVPMVITPNPQVPVVITPDRQVPVILTPQLPMPVEHGHDDERHPPRNPVRDFVENKRRKQVAESSINGTLTGEFNKLSHLPQHDHPASDTKEGGMQIKWDNDMFFIKWGHSSVAELTKVRRAPHASTGAPWPLPNRYARNEDMVFRVDAKSFRLHLANETCDILEEAVGRYKRLILESAVEDLYDNLEHAENTNINDQHRKYKSDLYRNAPILDDVSISVKKACDKYPSLYMDESYTLEIRSHHKRIVANEVWGALRGLETLSQLIWKGADSKLYVMETIAIDKPRFPHRGILIDTARHYIFKDVIYDVLRGMEHNKLNVFHWHMTDDQSFPFESKTYPEMSKKGAYHPSYVYTHEDVQDIVEFARLRGIRVIPEFDLPGHTYAWGHGRPDVIAKCYTQETGNFGMVGPIDPSKDSTYTFLKGLFTEILRLFPDEFIHAGGDEVPDACWRENVDLMHNAEQMILTEKGLIQNLERKIKSTVKRTTQHRPLTTHQLWEYFENRFMKDVHDLGTQRPQGVKFLMWQEASVKTNLKLVNNTIAQIWFGDAALMREAIDMGYRVLYSACWYLDMISFGADWPKYYNCDPAFPGEGVDERKVLGGEACLWAEYVDNENLMTRLWPRASAAAERLWSDRNVKGTDAAAPRLQEHRCRMLSRGLSVDQINGPDYCLRKGRVGGHRWSTYDSSRSDRNTDRFDHVTQIPSLSNGYMHSKMNEDSTAMTSNDVTTETDVTQNHDSSWYIMRVFQQHVSSVRARLRPHGSQIIFNDSVMVLMQVLVVLLVLGVFMKVSLPQRMYNSVRHTRHSTILVSFISLIGLAIMAYSGLWIWSIS